MLLIRSFSSEQIVIALRYCENGVALNVWMLWSLRLCRYLCESVGFINSVDVKTEPFNFILMSRKSTVSSTPPLNVKSYFLPTIFISFKKALNCLLVPAHSKNMSSRNLFLRLILFSLTFFFC